MLAIKFLVNHICCLMSDIPFTQLLLYIKITVPAGYIFLQILFFVKVNYQFSHHLLALLISY